MSRKDYILIAGALRDVQHKVTNSELKTAEEALSCTIANLIMELQNDNNRFDGQRFVEAIVHKKVNGKTVAV